MAKASTTLDWCIVRLGEDHNWWVSEVSDPVRWDVDGLGIIDPRQIREAVQWGADAILLIVRILTDDEIKRFMQVARTLEAGSGGRVVALYIPVKGRGIALRTAWLTSSSAPARPSGTHAPISSGEGRSIEFSSCPGDTMFTRMRRSA